MIKFLCINTIDTFVLCSHNWWFHGYILISRILYLLFLIAKAPGGKPTSKNATHWTKFHHKLNLFYIYFRESFSDYLIHWCFKHWIQLSSSKTKFNKWLLFISVCFLRFPVDQNANVIAMVTVHHIIHIIFDSLLFFLPISSNLLWLSQINDIRTQCHLS